MKTRNTILIFGGLALALVIGIFAWQLSALPNLRFQIQSGLHNSLQTIADQAAAELDATYTREILRGSQQMKKAVAPSAFAKENLPALRTEMLRVASTYPLADAWIAAFPDSTGRFFRAYAYQKPSRYRKEAAQDGSWREKTELSEFVRQQFQGQLQPYGTVDSFAATYWQNALDSNVVFVYNKAFNNAVFVGVPWFDRAADSLRGFLVCQTNAFHLDQVLIRDLFNMNFWAGRDKVEGLQRKHLQLGVMAGKGNKLVYNSVAYGAQEFEHTSALADINSWLSDYKVGLRFRGSSVEEVADGVYNRNLYLILAMFVLLIAFLGLLFRAAVRMVRLSRLKTEFVANVSHEIKTPLASIRLATDTLKLGRAKTPEQQAKVLGIIDSEAERLEHLIHTLLDFSQLEAGKKPYRFETLHVKNWWHNVQTLFLTRTKGETAIVDRLAELDQHVYVDEKAIEQVLTILIDNAHKYAPDSETIELHGWVEGEYIAIGIKDYGPGISRQNQGLIFEKFVRLGNVDVHDVKGHGIGLSMARAIVLDHGGVIRVEGKPGIGSLFIIELPILEEHQP